MVANGWEKEKKPEIPQLKPGSTNLLSQQETTSRKLEDRFQHRGKFLSESRQKKGGGLQRKAFSILKMRTRLSTAQRKPC